MNAETKSIRIAARHSDLARLQAYRVGGAIQRLKPTLKIEYSFRASLGDLNQDDPLWRMPEKGVFTEDFLKDLVSGSSDLVVHSWKDLPTVDRPQTEIIATLPRADVRDLLLLRRDRPKLGPLKILTSSPRRSYNLPGFFQHHLPFAIESVSFETVRGNIPTRLRKMLSQNVDGLILAKAALDRLLEAREPEFAEVQSFLREVLQKVDFMVLPLSINPTAAAQGALAIEIRRDRDDLRELLSGLQCQETFSTVMRERNILASYGGGCHQKIGITVLSRSYGELTFLRGLTDQGEVLERFALSHQRPEQPPAERADQLFPGSQTEGFFMREPLNRAAWSAAENERFLWVSRESAWPQEFVARADAVVWTAGLATWRHLASRGIWVHGCAESLGEMEPTRLETLLNEPAPRWVKLTHSTSQVVDQPQKMRPIATYQLVPRATAPDLHQKTHFYWMSGTTFDRAVELFPEIIARHHASGPGLTHEHIVKRLKALGASQGPAIHLDLGAWRRAVLPSPE